MKIIKLTFIFTFLFIGLIFSQDNTSILKSENYSIVYPSDWVLDDSGSMGTKFLLLSPQSSPTDQFQENVNLMIQDLAGYNLDLDKFIELSESQVTAMLTKGKVIESKRMANNQGDYQYMIFTGGQGQFDLKFIQNIWLIEEKAYVLTFTAEEKSFDTYQHLGSIIMESFVIKVK